MGEPFSFVVYGAPPGELAEVPPGAVQLSPLIPGSGALEALETDSLERAVVLAPPGTVERRYTLAHVLRALKPGAPLTVLAPKDKGGSRLRKELEAFGCTVEETGRRHHRICETMRPEQPTGLEPSITAGAPRFDQTQGLWTQPGVFSWDRLDPGTEALLTALPPLKGAVADLGCGVGVIARAVLASPAVTAIELIDLDRRAIDAARRNVSDPRARFHWADARTAPQLTKLDFVVMNPPFHDAGDEDRGLGQAFIQRAHAMLRKGGALWLVANRHLPYETTLAELFTRVTPRREGSRFKVYEATK